MKKIVLILISLAFVSNLFADGNYYYNGGYYDPYYQPRYKKRVKKKRIKRVKRVKKVYKGYKSNYVKRPVKRGVKSAKSRSNLHTLFGKVGNYYAGVEIAKTSLSRKVTLNSKNTGEILYRSDNGAPIGTADGSTYNFTQSYNYTKFSMVVGFVQKKSGDIYQISYSSNDLMQDLLLSAGYSYKKFGYKYTYGFIPNLTVLAGFGYTGSTNAMPTNFSIGVGGGLYKFYKKKYRVEGGLKYQKRSWIKLDKSIGQEKWDDSELSFYVGVGYLF